MERFDFLVVGGGMAGVSAGYELAQHGSVCVLEREDQLAFHSTGRSAAHFLETYGNAPVRALTRGSRAFYDAPPAGAWDAPVAARRGALFVAEAAHVAELRAHFEAVQALGTRVRWLEHDELPEQVPCLAPDRWQAGLLEPDAADLDVHAILQGYARGLRARGGVVRSGEEVTAVSRAAGRWVVTSTGGTRSARVLVNAAGAWADVLARLAGAPPIGLTPLRRTIALVDPPPGDISSWPLVASVPDELYFKPESSRLLVSPCDETPSEPCNAAPDPYDVALAVDRLERATTLRPQHVSHRWAGLRSFVADRTPVVGPDPLCEGLVWIAAQGGYGIQTAPALARVCRALAQGEGIPEDLAALGLTAEHLSPGRAALRRGPGARPSDRLP
jgi:D-arginine dehydrogenase